jgi:predicted hotdog family 3-hydroxylacyl-ACP dehydratase
VLNIENIPIQELVPHANPMLLLDHAKYFSENYIHTVVKVCSSSQFSVIPGEVPSYVALEYMAQSIAAWNGMAARLQNCKPKVGFLIGSRNLILKVSSFKENILLNIYGKSNYNNGEMASFDCWVEHHKETVVTATLNVCQPKNITIFI